MSEDKMMKDEMLHLRWQDDEGNDELDLRPMRSREIRVPMVDLICTSFTGAVHHLSSKKHPDIDIWWCAWCTRWRPAANNQG